MSNYGDMINSAGFLAICSILLFLVARAWRAKLAEVDRAIRLWAERNGYEVLAIRPETPIDRADLRVESQQIVRRVTVRSADDLVHEAFAICGGRFLEDRGSNLEIRWRG